MGKQHRMRKKFSLISLLVLLLSFGSIFFYDVIVDRAKMSFSFGKLNSAMVNSIACNADIAYDRDVIFEVNGKGIIKIEQSSFIFYDVNGDPLWEKEINSPSPIVRFGEDVIIVGDYGTGEIYSLNHSGDINQSIPGLGRIQDIRLGENGVIVVVLEQDNEVVLLDKGLDEITRISLPKGDLIDFDLSSNKSLLAFSFIQMDKSNFYSNVLLYTLDGRLIGATNFEEQYLFGLQVVEDNIVGILDSELFVVNSENELLKSIEIDRRIEKFYLDRDGYVFLNLTKNPEDLTDTRPDNVISILSLDGEKIVDDIIIESPIDQMVVNESYLTFLSGDKIYQLDKKTGELLKIQTLEKDALKVHLITKNVLGIEYIDKFDIYSLVY